MRKAEGNVGVIGWGTMPDDNEFLEMRVAHGGKTVPEGLDDALPVSPHPLAAWPLEKISDGVVEVSRDLQRPPTRPATSSLG
jgi:hypothetical protein